MPKQKQKEIQTRAGIREWLGLGVLGLTSLSVAIDLFVMLLALPKIGQELHASATQLLWVTDMYGFLLAGFLITMGTLGDRIGRRKVLLIGSGAFALSSVLVAFSPNVEMLILSRALLGVAGAMIGPAGFSLIRHMFADRRQNAIAISILLSCLIGGSVLGPLVGGILLEHFWWGSVFLVGVPPMILALLLGKKLLPEYKNPHASKLHFPSVFLSLGAILPFIYGIKELAAHGWEPFAVLALAVGIVFGIIFVRQQKKLTDPLLDMALFKKPEFTIMLVAMMINTLLPGGIMVLSTQYLQLVAGLTPLQAGLWMIPAMAGSIIGFLVSPHFARKIRPAYLIAIGLACSILGMIILCFTAVDSGFWALITGFFLFNLGAGPLTTLGVGIVIGSVPGEKAGVAAGVSQTGNEFGFALGVAIVGSISAFVYRLQTAVLPEGVSEASAHSIRETLATAVSTAKDLPEALSADVLHVARSAFIDAYHTIAVISAIALVIIAVIIVTVLRKIPPMNDTEG